MTRVVRVMGAASPDVLAAMVARLGSYPDVVGRLAGLEVRTGATPAIEATFHNDLTPEEEGLVRGAISEAANSGPAPRPSAELLAFRDEALDRLRAMGDVMLAQGAELVEIRRLLDVIRAALPPAGPPGRT